MNALTTLMSRCRIHVLLGAGIALLLTACGGNMDETAGPQLLATVETTGSLAQAQAQGQEAPVAEAAAPDAVPVTDAQAGPASAAEQFQANSEMAYGTAAQPDDAGTAPDAPHAGPEQTPTN